MSLKWMHLLILGSCLVLHSSAIKCYTCGGSDDENASCSNFQIEDPQFSRECEISSRSCRLSRRVNENVILSRSCEGLRLDDCKTANSIEFCYCTKDLCNKINPSDDEEEDEEFLDVEGSGTRKIDLDTTTEARKPNEDIVVSGEATNIEANVISPSCCSFRQPSWCLVMIFLISLYI